MCESTAIGCSLHMLIHRDISRYKHVSVYIYAPQRLYGEGGGGMAQETERMIENVCVHSCVFEKLLLFFLSI